MIHPRILIPLLTLAVLVSACSQPITQETSKSPVQQSALNTMTASESETALILAAFDGDAEKVRKLVEAGTNVNAIRNLENQTLTPLLAAAAGSHRTIYEYLITNGASATATYQGYTASDLLLFNEHAKEQLQ